MKEAQWWSTANGKIQCYLCPRYCKIGKGQNGFCFIRKNIDGTLQSLAYGSPCSVNIDPIEKKPLFHFYPGTNILSLGTLGCNLGCLFCQNWSITKIKKAKEPGKPSRELLPDDVVKAALNNNCPGIAYTYNEPTIWAEYAVDIAKIAHSHSIKSVMVTNGYITKEAFHDVYDNIDGANVDLKSFNEHFYRKYAAAHIDPVLQALLALKKETNVWFEITTLLIPGLNDNDEETKKLCAWILNELGPDIPLHFTAFHPDYKMHDRGPTPAETLEHARYIAMQCGIHFVYVGNVSSNSANTYCPQCNKLLIQRGWHSIVRNELIDGKCSCGEAIPGRWMK
ncbi:MAG: AmmeMemoRadiSam system radical SAM enzyme [Candidatus Fischerbacteria bacterium RBG_13_37_8]|uniref:AmmeMemoRadiSam system radical SAM enzyme n=1 Tax=Candidatus Fischerbacteria bacterium RBG_13_37_8 TaxID=1817863 RepID=A0A1F5VVK9_9BACT|nr:MAG: AmmeMemoRadiSam system radical SAM enzyme [Candidatus Fischerbacteria bacterium RBG_13_37_8]